MSKLDDLINKLCPDGVEYKKLNEASVMQRGTSLTKANSVEGDFPVISGGKEPAFYCNKYNREGETITVAGSGAGAGFVQYWAIPLFANDCFTLKATENNSTKYIYYFLTSIQNKINETKKGGGVPHVHISDIENFEIPVPPLEIQNEIVRILDNFTELEEELEEELEARRKQYEYYRDSLLTFDDAVEWSTLGENAIVTKLAGFEFTEHVRYQDSGEIIALRGLNVKKGHLVLDDVKYIDGSNFEKLNRSKLYINDMLFTYVGTVGQVALIDKNDKYYLAPNVALVRFENKKINPEFMKFYFQTYHFQRLQIDKYSGSSSMKNLTMENIRKFSIPIPDLEVQNKIVKILSNFEIMTEDITSGLPAEIEVRHKQYEYYRDKLLTFKRKNEK